MLVIVKQFYYKLKKVKKMFVVFKNVWTRFLTFTAVSCHISVIIDLLLTPFTFLYACSQQTLLSLDMIEIFGLRSDGGDLSEVMSCRRIGASPGHSHTGAKQLG